MNKNFSTILNVILLVAVIILYYLHFSSAAPVTAETTVPASDSAVADKPLVLAPKDIKASNIVYLNLDKLNEGYDYIKELNASANAEQSSLEKQYQSKGKKLQDDYMEFQQKAQAGLLSENQINTQQADFETRKNEVDQIGRKLQELESRMEDRQIELHETMIKYLKEYNKTSKYNYVLGYTEQTLGAVLAVNDSLDITDEIVAGLNAQYAASKGKKK